METAEKLKAKTKEPISAYQLRDLLRGLERVIQRMPMVLSKDLSDNLESSVEDATKQAARCLETVAHVEETIRKKEAEMCERFDVFWKTIKDKYAKMRAMAEELPKLPDIEIPYGFDRLIDVAQRCQNMTDDQWARMKDLAQALAVKKD